MAAILLVLAHPGLDRSRTHAALLRAVADLDALATVDLYERYPDFDVDADAEQEALRRCDVVVLQHPIFWYSAPALLKEWIDRTLTYGFAYDVDGGLLSGKRCFNVISTDWSLESYSTEGAHRLDLRDFLAPFEFTARHCGMDYVAPFVIANAHAGKASSKLASECKRYRALLRAIAGDRIDWEAARGLRRLGPDVEQLLLAEPSAQG